MAKGTSDVSKAARLKAMREGGKHLGRIRRELLSMLAPGLDLFKVELQAQKQIRAIGAAANFSEVNGYGFATCLMVNDEVVHVKPRRRILKKGDLVTVDVGLKWHGWHLDTADSILVSETDDRFVATGRIALMRAIARAVPGNRVGHISQAMQKVIEGNGYSSVRKYCGHGIGRSIHEEPQIFCFLDKPMKETMLLKEGMTVAVEVMMNEGGNEVIIEKDGWYCHSADGSRSAQFEHTILITSGTPEILTL